MAALWSFLHFIWPIVALSLLGAFLARVWKGSGSPVADGPEDEVYKIYTREFDLVLQAHEALAKLDDASPDGANGWLSGGKAKGQEPLVETLLADQRAALASGRARLMASLRAALRGADPADMAVAILIDQSGSMKGERIALAAATATLIAELVDELGARSEVLGFSTAGWRGGHARLKWLEQGRPKRPGRLAALMHVVYKSADDPAFDEESRRVMVHPDLLRENIDGEAILWASERLAALPQRRKSLIVISDGAPVDDSTLAQNGPSYLYRHLKTVLAAIESAGDVTIGGLGINHRVDAFYPLSETVEAPADLPAAGLRLFETMIAASAERASH